MRTHQDIISDAGGVAKLADTLALDPNTVKAWRKGSSIPGRYWAEIEDAGIATVRELADSAKAPVAKRVA